jgi:hypothetical protein
MEKNNEAASAQNKNTATQGTEKTDQVKANPKENLFSALGETIAMGIALLAGIVIFVFLTNLSWTQGWELSHRLLASFIGFVIIFSIFNLLKKIIGLLTVISLVIIVILCLIAFAKWI